MALRDWLSNKGKKGRPRAERTASAGAAPEALDPTAALLWNLAPVDGGRRDSDETDKVVVAESLALYGHPQEGINVLRPQGTTEPPAEQQMSRGWLAFLQGNFHDARTLSARAMRRAKPGRMRQLTAIRCAWIHLATWDVPVVRQAIQCLEAEKLAPEWACVTQLAKAQLFALTGEITAAREAFEPARRKAIDSEEPALRYQLAVAQNDLHDLEDALLIVRQTVQAPGVPPTGRALLWLEAGRTLALLGKHEASHACLDLVVHDWPELGRTKSVEVKGESRPEEEAILAAFGNA